MRPLDFKHLQLQCQRMKAALKDWALFAHKRLRQTFQSSSILTDKNEGWKKLENVFFGPAPSWLMNHTAGQAQFIHLPGTWENSNRDQSNIAWFRAPRPPADWCIGPHEISETSGSNWPPANDELNANKQLPTEPNCHNTQWHKQIRDHQLPTPSSAKNSRVHKQPLAVDRQVSRLIC